MKTKQLTLRLAGERFGIPKTTVCRHVARKYAKFWAGTPAFGAVLDERIEKHRMVLLIATLVWLWACNMHIYATVLTKFQKSLFCTHLVTWPCLQNFQWVLKNVLRKPLWTSAQFHNVWNCSIYGSVPNYASPPKFHYVNHVNKVAPFSGILQCCDFKLEMQIVRCLRYTHIPIVLLT